MLLPTLGKPTTATVGRRFTRAGSCQSPARGPSADDAADDLVRRPKPGGVELDRVLGGAQGAVLALGVAGVAAALGGEHRTRSPRRSARRGGAARSSSEAVRKTFSGESGLTTVPMSRPSAT